MQWTDAGHEPQKKHLEALIERGELAHAYLLAGPEGIGKRAVAEDIARALIREYTALDVMRCAPERDEDGKIHDIPIEEITRLKSWIALRPIGSHKVAIIDGADRLGQEAANNLLKVLEEPPAYAHFFLISAQHQHVMGTIASRCERMDFRPVVGAVRATSDDAQHIASVAAFERVLTQGITEQLLFAKKIADSEQALEEVSWWLTAVHQRLPEHPELAPVAHGLIELRATLSESQYNRRLALDHFFFSTGLK